MLKHMPWNFEELHRNDNDSALRVKVIGGWIVLHHSWLNGAMSESMTFVPDIDHQWKITEPKADPIVEQSTLAKDFEC